MQVVKTYLPIYKNTKNVKVYVLISSITTRNWSRKHILAYASLTKMSKIDIIKWIKDNLLIDKSF